MVNISMQAAEEAQVSFIFLPSRLCRGFGPRRNGGQKYLFFFAFDRLGGVSFRRAAMSALRGLGAGAAWRGRSQCGLVASLHVCPRAARLPLPSLLGYPAGRPACTPAPPSPPRSPQPLARQRPSIRRLPRLPSLDNWPTIWPTKWRTKW